MARFYAEIEGNRGRASRLGTPSSGMWAHVRGWEIGVKIVIDVDPEGRDRVNIYRTSGSNDTTADQHLLTLYEDTP